MKTNLLLQMACAALMIYSFTLSRGAAAPDSDAFRSFIWDMILQLQVGKISGFGDLPPIPASA